MLTRHRVAKAVDFAENHVESPLINPPPFVGTGDLRHGQCWTGNSFAFWFGAEAAFSDEVSMKIIGKMAYERHIFADNSRLAAEGVLDKWKESVKF